jgi:nucleotide-binding universal stress UspA family protein
MTYKTILVDCDASPKVGHRLAVAVELAGRFGAHLIGLHVRAPILPQVFADGTLPMESLLDAFEQAAKAEEAAATKAFEAAVKGSRSSTEWRVVEGFSEELLTNAAHQADLLVLGQIDPDSATRATPPRPEAVVMASGRPAIVVPHVGIAGPPGKTVMLCWKPTRESARAAADALPFLTAAEKVIVLIVDRAAPEGDPAAEVTTWLERHGIKASVQHDIASDSDVGDVILSRAADNRADLIVMGLYGHSRLRQMVLGGVSRTLLASMTTPLFVAH